MTPAKRKIQQDSVKPEGQENVEKASVKRKPNNEESMLSDEPQNIEPNVRPPALTINIHSWATPLVATDHYGTKPCGSHTNGGSFGSATAAHGVANSQGTSLSW